MSHYSLLPTLQELIHLPQIHKAKAEKARERILKDEMDAKRAKTKAARERRQERIQQKRLAGEEVTEEEEAAANK